MCESVVRSETRSETRSKTTADGEDIPWRCGHCTGAGAAVSFQTEKVGQGGGTGLHLPERHASSTVFGLDDVLFFTCVSPDNLVRAVSEEAN